MKYLPLLTIDLKHTYYSDGRCPDFTVIPSDATARLLKNHRCVAKPRWNGLSVYVSVNAAVNPIIPFNADSTLSFDLHLQNPEFSLYTDYTNLPKNVGFRINNSGLTSNANEALATIEIQRDFNQLEPQAADIEISFSAKPLYWAYYLVTNQTANTNDFSIIDGGQETVKMTWQPSDPPSSDSIAKTLAGQYPDMKMLRFVSTQKMPCREASTQDVQLWLGGNKIFEHLPSPSYRNFFQTDMTSSLKATDSIFKIVKYITNSTLIKG